MKNTTLKCIGPLLDTLRLNPALHEEHLAAFHLSGRDFIHFHDESEGIFADVLLSKGRVRMPVSTPAEQSELLEKIDRILSSLDSRHQRRRTNKRQE